MIWEVLREYRELFEVSVFRDLKKELEEEVQNLQEGEEAGEVKGSNW